MSQSSEFLNIMKESTPISDPNMDLSAVKRAAISAIGSVILPETNSEEDLNKFYADVTGAIIDNVADKNLSITLLDELDYHRASNTTAYRVIRALTNKITLYQTKNESVKSRRSKRLQTESVMAPTGGTYSAEEIQPLVCFAIFGKDKEPLLNSKGVIITSKMSDTFNQDYANSLYALIGNAKEIYVIDNEVYNQAADIRDDSEFYKFVKDNGELLKWTNQDDFPDLPKDETLFDDTDFIIE